MEDNIETEKENKSENMKPPLSSFVSIIFILVLLGIYGAVYLIDDILPTPLKISDEQDNPDSFIAESAQRHLQALTDIGPRVTGSYENEVLTVDYLVKEINLIQNRSHPNQKIEVDVQVVSGAFNATRSGINAYTNVQNVVVKLHSRNNSQHSLLVNVHFDSVPVSPGGSDDGINCAALLEILRKLTQSDETFEHNVIFLFNGAEETPVQGSHGFITQHKWAKEVEALVNLEAAGAGGKVMLFQAGPSQPWLLSYYNGVPHPFAQALAEELFLAGLIPSDTDFRIFRDYGGVVGLDFAFIRNGYRYHTRFDRFSNIPGGSYQYVGDNTLYLIRVLANAPELAYRNALTTKDTIFYDYLGLFMISYSQTVAIVINSVTATLSLVVAIKGFYDFRIGCSGSTLLYLGVTTLAILLSLIAPAVVVIAIAVLVDALKFTMSWYGNPWILFGLYVAPVILCSCGVIVLSNYFILKKKEWKLNVRVHTQIQSHLLRLLWTLPLVIGTVVGVRGVYVILIPVLFQTLSFALIHIFGLYRSNKIWLTIYYAGTVIPNLFLMQTALTVLTFFVPITGRTGPYTNPELNIGIFTFALTLQIISVYVPFITLIRKPGILLGVLSATFVVFFIIVVTPLGFPYSGDAESPAPQRFWIYHARRIFRDDDNAIYKEDSGFYIYNQDRNSPDSIEEYVKELSNVTSIAEDCNRSLFCGLPLGRYTNARAADSTWIPAEDPVFHEPIDLQLDARISIDSFHQFNFTASGPDRFEIYISPRTDANLTSISLWAELPPKPIIWNGRPLYVIIHTWAKNKASLPFSLRFVVPDNWTGPMFDIALVGRYLHDKINAKTRQYTEFLNEFPDWTDVVPMLSAYESWVY